MSSRARFYCWPFAGTPVAACGVVMSQLLAGDGVAVSEADDRADELLALNPADRVLVVNSADVPLFGHSDDLLDGGKLSLWHPHGVLRAVGQYLPFARRLAERGVRLAGVAFDGEAGPCVWSADFDAAALVADPRYAEAARRYDLPLDPWSDPMRFNRGAALIAAREFAAVADAVLRYHPDAWWSNYADSPLSAADAVRVPDFNGHAAYYAPSGQHTYSPVWYGHTDQLTKANAKTYGRGGRKLTSYERVAWSWDQVPAAQRADDDARFRVWTAGQPWGGFSDAHAVEIAVLSLLAGRGRGLHWAGNGLTAEQYARDADRLDAAAAIFDALAGGVDCLGPVPTDLRGDAGYALVAAAQFADGSVRGRAVWSDKAKPGRAHTLGVAKDVSVRLTRAADESGQSFVARPAGSERIAA